MVFIAIANGYGQSITFFRYGLVLVSIILLKNYYRILILEFSKNTFLTVGLSYLGICIGLYMFGISYGLPVAWWQEYLWTGTAYSAFVIFIIIAISLLNSFTMNQRLLFLGLGFLSGAAMDSRLAFLLILTLFPFVFNGKKRSKSAKGLLSVLKSFFIFIFILLSLSSLFITYNKEITSVFKSAQTTIIDLSDTTNRSDRDSDRQDNLRAVGSLMIDEPFKFVFGSGLTSHQYELSAYLNKSSDNKVRPSGLPAVVFDGGIVYLLIILACAFNSILQFISHYLSNLISLRSLFIFTAVIMNSLLVLLITNTTDLMLWWAVILSGNIVNKKIIIQFNESM